MPSQSLSSFLELADAGGKGPRPSFTRAHFLLAFMSIGEMGMIGRQALAKQAGLGEGATRTVLKKLKDAGYIGVDASGAHLTKSGTAFYSWLGKRLTRTVMLEGMRLSVGGRQCAIGVRAGVGRVQNGIKQRDSAMIAGASGATTYTIRRSKFAVPGGSPDCEKDFPGPAWRVIRKEIKPRDGDAVVVSGANDAMSAKLGALSAALTLL